MASANGDRGPRSPRPVSALPSVQARLLAFAAILVAGVSGGLIGSSAVKVGCQGSCATPEGIGGVVGAVTAAGGVAVIAVLVLRAMGEWRSIKEKRLMETMMAAAAAAASVPEAGDAGEAGEAGLAEDRGQAEDRGEAEDRGPPGDTEATDR